VTPADEPSPLSEPARDVRVVGLRYWADHIAALGSELRRAASAGAVKSPTLDATDDTELVISDVDFWRTNPEALEEGVREGAFGPEEPIRGIAVSLPPRLTLTVEEAAAILGISRAFAYEAVRRGDIPSIRIGRRVLVPQAALARMLADEADARRGEGNEPEQAGPS
jgi:excisionase family DNA binding protein